VNSLLASLPPYLAAVEDDQVTPGVIGFVVTAVFAVVCILLIIDMVRRMRRVRYRAEVQEEIAAELEARRAAEAGDSELGAQGAPGASER